MKRGGYALLSIAAAVAFSSMFCGAIARAQETGPDCGQAPAIAGSTWNMTDSTGQKQSIEFKRGGQLVDITPKSVSPIGTWKQEGKCIYFEMNAKYVEFNGRMDGDEMKGTAKNRFDFDWTWTALKRGGRVAAKPAGSGFSLQLVKVARTTAPPSGLFRPPALKRDNQWWQVFVELTNSSNAPLSITSPNSQIFLRYKGKDYPAVDVLWEGTLHTSMEITNGRVTTELRVDGGDTAVLSPAFVIPFRAAESEVELHFLGSTPLSLGSLTTSSPARPPDE